MPFTLVHGVISFFVLSFFTKDRRLWLLAFIAGMLPDIDGFPILWDMELFYAIHHELLHPLIYGIVLGIPAALLLNYFFKIDKAKSLLVFATAFMLHPVFDVFFTNWPVKLFWPLYNEQFSYPFFIDYNLLLWPLVPVMVAVPFIIDYFRNRAKSGALHQNG